MGDFVIGKQLRILSKVFLTFFFNFVKRGLSVTLNKAAKLTYRLEYRILGLDGLQNFLVEKIQRLNLT